jgi:XTP/dITP diphosphohydrolase
VVEQPGTRLLDLVAVMDRLRSPGGCPWDREQTHRTLAPYLLEETHETLEAIDTGDLDHLREELGDLLLQVVFHARVAAEHPEQPWTIDDVAAGITAKLVRRHPHVFADATAPTAAHVEVAWERIKAAEKQRESALDGIPDTLPALALAAKTVSRARRARLPLPPSVAPSAASDEAGRTGSGPSDAAPLPLPPSVAPPAASDEAGRTGSGPSDAAPLLLAASDEAGAATSGPSDAAALPPPPSAAGALALDPSDEQAVGRALLALVADAEAAGVDAELALRRAVRDYAGRVREAERQGAAALRRGEAVPHREAAS